PNDANPNLPTGNGLGGISIASLPLPGILTYNSQPVPLGFFVSKADLDAGNKLVFTPALNTSGTGYASFTFFAVDNGGTAIRIGDDGSSSRGVDRAQTPNTMTIDVQKVPPPPQGGDSTITIPEDVTYTISASPLFTGGDFHFGDPNDSPANNFVAAKIVSFS